MSASLTRLRQRARGGHEHLVGHQSCSAGDRAKTDAGEDVRIIALPRHEGLAVEFHRIVRTAACEQRAAVGMAVGLLGGAFRLRGRIGERKHDRPLVDLRHGLQHLGREGAADRRDADDRGGLERADRRQEVADRRVRMGVTKFVLVEAGAVLDDQAARIHQPDAQARLGFGSAFRHHGRDHEIGDAGRSLAGAEEEHLLVGQFAAGHAQRREQARERHRGRALDVVVEDGNLVAIFVQQTESRMIGEILELDQHAGERRARGGNEFVDELVIGGAAQPLLAQSDIIGIVQQRFVVGADVQHDRQAELRVHAGAGGIERELADRNAHAVGAEVAEAEDALAVGHHDKLCRIGPVAQQFGDAPAIVGADEKAARPLEDVAEPLAGEADRRGVDKRLDFIDVVAHDAEEQRLVAVVQRVERNVFFEVVRQAAQIGQHALGLRLHRKHVRGQKAAQSQRVALLLGESGALVEQRIAQQRHAARCIFIGFKTIPPPNYLDLTPLLLHEEKKKCRLMFIVGRPRYL